MLKISCPNCNAVFDDDMPALEDGADFTCPQCETEITITMSFEPEPRKAA